MMLLLWIAGAWLVASIVVAVGVALAWGLGEEDAEW